MSYTALYRKWRPLVFEDVVEQEHVVKTIKNTVMSGRIGHAYLFCGTRGTGKTTMAKIFARAINCLNPKDGNPCNECEICKGILSDSILDVVEIDAASNNSVDNVREIRDEVVYAPSQAKYKVYIIDEVHMLSAGAFNALLKTLEEPPEHVKFILATTDPHKLPATILSRCQRFDFKKITPASIAKRVKKVANATDIQIEDDAALLIARLADGAMRDALSILDQCIATGDKTIFHQNVLDVVGIVSDDFIAEIVDNIKDRNTEGLVNGVERLSSSGRDILRFASDLVMYFRNLLMCKLSNNPSEIIDVSKQYLEKMIAQSKSFSKDNIIEIVKELSSFETQLKYALNQRVFLEVMLISISAGNYGHSTDNSDLMDRVTDLEDKLKNGAYILNSTNVLNAGHQNSNGDVTTAQSSKSQKDSTGVKGIKLEKKKINYSQLEIWEDVIKELKSRGRMKIFSYISNTKAVVADESTILVVFPSDERNLIDAVKNSEDIQVLQDIISSKLATDIRVKIVDEDELESTVPFKATTKKDTQENDLIEISTSNLNEYLEIKEE